MIKQTLYPKTSRLQVTPTITVTEKVDGSNLVLFTVDGKLHIAQRNNVYAYEEVLAGTVNKSIMYRGLRQFLDDHYKELEANIFEGSALCGEWIGMGKLKYENVFGDHRFLMFAKARHTFEDGKFGLTNIQYDIDNFSYCFNDQKVPEFIGTVPVVIVNNSYNTLTIDYLNYLYEFYTNEVDRPVEGFVVHSNGSILKYVRMKNGTLADHFDRGE